MRQSQRTIVALTAGTLLMAGCAASPAALNVHSHVGTYTLQDTASGGFSVKADAPWASLDTAKTLPVGDCLHLAFKAVKGKDKGKRGDRTIEYTDGVPFTVSFVPGATFAVLDGDATDGATVQVPAGTYDLFTKAQGHKDGSLTITDPLYFVRGTVASTGDRGYAHIGARSLPFAQRGVLGDYRLTFGPQGAEGFATDLVPSQATAATPPLPPSVTGLTSDNQVKAGKTATVKATTDGDVRTYRWSTTDPAGVKKTDNPVGGANAVFTAPNTTGKYWIGLTVENAYYVGAPATPLAISVIPSLVLRASVAYNAWGWDIANLTVTGLDLSPILCSDGQLHTPNSFKAVNMDGNMFRLHAAYPNWYDPTTGNGNYQWWTWAGYWRRFGVTTVGAKAVFDAPGVHGEGPIQGTTTFIN